MTSIYVNSCVNWKVSPRGYWLARMNERRRSAYCTLLQATTCNCERSQLTRCSTRCDRYRCVPAPPGVFLPVRYNTARRHSGLRNGGARAPRRRRFQRRSGSVLFKWRCGGGVVGGICGHVAIAASSCENRTFKHRSGSRRGSDTKQQHRRRRRSWFRSRCSELPMAPKVSQQGGHSGEGGHEGGSHWCQRGAT